MSFMWACGVFLCNSDSTVGIITVFNLLFHRNDNQDSQRNVLSYLSFLSAMLVVCAALMQFHTVFVWNTEISNWNGCLFTLQLLIQSSILKMAASVINS